MPTFPAQPSPANKSIALCVLFPVFFLAILVSHFTLLRLPYFWDEGGYYVPAALDFFRTGTLIPQSTVTNAHPPLPDNPHGRMVEDLRLPHPRYARPGLPFRRRRSARPSSASPARCSARKPPGSRPSSPLSTPSGLPRAPWPTPTSSPPPSPSGPSPCISSRAKIARNLRSPRSSPSPLSRKRPPSSPRWPSRFMKLSLALRASRNRSRPEDPGHKAFEVVRRFVCTGSAAPRLVRLPPLQNRLHLRQPGVPPLQRHRQPQRLPHLPLPLPPHRPPHAAHEHVRRCGLRHRCDLHAGHSLQRARLSRPVLTASPSSSPPTSSSSPSSEVRSSPATCSRCTRWSS